MDVNMLAFIVTLFVAIGPYIHARYQVAANKTKLDVAFRHIDTQRDQTARLATEVELLKAKTGAHEREFREIKDLLKKQGDCLHKIDLKLSALSAEA